MKSAAGWADACIVDLSGRGAGLQAAVPPARGTFLEIRRGEHVIVARVMWSRGHRFGIRSQDRLAVDAIARDLKPVDEARPSPVCERRQTLRRSAHASSRWLARRMEFGFVAAAIIGGAGLIGVTIRDQLVRPLASIEAVLGGSG